MQCTTDGGPAQAPGATSPKHRCAGVKVLSHDQAQTPLYTLLFCVGLPLVRGADPGGLARFSQSRGGSGMARSRACQ